MVNKSWPVYFVLLLACFAKLGQSRPAHKRRNLSGCHRQKSSPGSVEIYATVSSFSYVTKDGTMVSRQLEINWYGREARAGDRIALFDKDPLKDPSALHIVDADPSFYPDGYFRTNVDFPYVYFNLTSLGKDPCLGYFVAYLANGVVTSSSCLQVRPFWMHTNKQFLQNQRLSDIMIPGSHDSGCFTSKNRKAPNTLIRFKYAQDEPIFNQLVYGIRYFDLRVGYYGHSKDKFYINHSILKTDHSLTSILSQVRSFLEATKEIVILDFHNFPIGFNLQVHLEFMQMIYSSLEQYLIPYNSDFSSATLGELWSKDKRVLVAYNHPSKDREPHNVLWPEIPRAWGNKQYPDDLKKYFEDVYSKPVPEGLWASMAEMTPNARFIMSHPHKGLRVLADEINRNVTHWFRDEFWQTANIVATDYFLGNNLIDVAIKTNREKFICVSGLTSNDIR